MKTFIQLKRTEETEDLLTYYPNAFLLLTQIALRARRTPNLIKNLKVCECMIGDYEKCGLTEQKYRTAKKVLESNGLATFKTTNKGTIAKIINSDIYDINASSDNEQDNRQVTIKQRSSNDQATTNNKEKNVKNVKKYIYPENYSDSLKEKFNDFIENRKALKKPVTEKAFTGLVNKLNKLSNSNEAIALQILDESIINGWQGLFQLNNNGGKNDNRNRQNYNDQEYKTSFSEKRDNPLF